MKIVIVGGGTAGWLLAARLSKSPTIGDGLSVTLVEAPEIATVGVGEGTWPSMRQTLKQIGVDEAEFVRRCNASFKQGTYFSGWNAGPNQSYCHPFDAPIVEGFKNIGEYWLNHKGNRDSSFETAMSLQANLSGDGLAPKTLSTPNYQGHLNYGYHLDAAGFAAFLKDICTEKERISYIQGKVQNVNLDTDGNVLDISLDDGRVIEGDLFFDCTGFRSLILHQAMGVDFTDLSKNLFVDRALAMQVPYCDAQERIHSMTRSTAHDAGWIWDIGLANRRGVGLVYSSSHMEEEVAAQKIQSYLGPQCDVASAKSISFQSRRLKTFWKNNAIAVGLSSGFLEPLEASAIVFVELAANWFVERMPKTKDEVRLHAKLYNQAFTAHWDRTVEFLKFHYVLSNRKEDFWRDNREGASWPSELAEKMEIWATRAPYFHDFTGSNELFSWESYQFVYFGMGQGVSPFSVSQHDEKAPINIDQRILAKARSVLPSNRDLLAKLTNQSFAAI